MDTNSAAATNEVITRVYTFHDQAFNYGWSLVVLLGFMLIAWAARKIFWQKDSN